MRKIIVAMHTTLDGFTAGNNGEMNWINLDEKLFDFIGKLTDGADMALYGRKTYEMMDSYWPTAGQRPNASKHDIEHSHWYNNVTKIVLSKTMTSKGRDKTVIINNNIDEEIKKIKSVGEKNIMIFGSASVVHFLFQENLLDELWLFVNPVVIGNGIPMFKGISEVKKLKLIQTKQFSNGVVGLNYSK